MSCEHKRQLWSGDMKYGTCKDCGSTLGEPRPMLNDPRGLFEEVAHQLHIAGQGGIDAVLDNNPDELVELLDTGSVTLKLLGKQYVLTLNVKEAT